MQVFKRYAIYHAPPPDTPLGRFGADWLGWDLDAAAVPPARGFPALPLPRAEITAQPRRYGFHATLKAPFRLAPGTEPDALAETMAAVAAAHCALTVPLRLVVIGRFLALVPVARAPSLERLAQDCVVAPDRFRAAPGEAELARRREPGLSPQEEAHLRRWGYPHVLDTYRFHLTLTGSLCAAEREQIREALDAMLGPTPVLRLGDIGIFGERNDGFFQKVHRFRLNPSC